MRSATATRTELDVVTHKTTNRTDLSAEVRRALLATGYPELQQVRVHVDDDRVILHGCVTTYYQKQLAQEAAMHVDGVESLRNEIDIGAGSESAVSRYST